MILLPLEYWGVKQTKNKGKGIFAKKDIPKGRLVGDYLGKVLRTKDIDFNLDKEKLYLMYYHDLACIYPDLTKDGIHLLNHSCSPNSFIYTHKGHTLVFTIRNILKGEELTISYQMAPKGKFENPCTHKCFCESKNCTGTMHLTEEKYQQWRKFQSESGKDDKRARIRYGQDLKPLLVYPKTIPEDLLTYISAI